MLAALASLALVVAATAPTTVADSPPVDHAAIADAEQAAVAAGAPSFLYRAVDETGAWTATAGVADLKTGAPASPDAAFRIGSITKMFVAVTILKLVDAGRLALDAPVGQYLPGLLARGDAITIRDLLQHRSGLRDGPFWSGHGNTWFPAINALCSQGADPVTQIKLADAQASEPGTTFAYANANYTTLGLMIQAATDEPYPQVIDELVLRPLGLGSTSFQDGTPVWPTPFLHGYGDFLPGRVEHSNVTDETDCVTSQWGAAGSGISTTADLITFIGALVHGQLLPDTLYQQMLDFVPAPEFGSGWEYGLGIMRVTGCGGTVIVGHSGAVFGYQSELWATPDGTRSSAKAIPIYPGTYASLSPVGTVNFLEFCGG